MASPEEFKTSIAKWVEKAEGKTQKFIVNFLMEFNETLVYNTPVITGTLRGSWYADLNAVPQAISGPRDPGGAGVLSRLNIVAQLIKPGDTYHVANGTYYAIFVEYGTTRMAPRAFVRSTLADVDRMASDALSKL